MDTETFRPLPRPYIKEEGRGRKIEAVRFSEMKVPAPRRYLLKDLVLAAYVTLLTATEVCQRACLLSRWG
jgi:hypothetical protein